MFPTSEPANECSLALTLFSYHKKKKKKKKKKTGTDQMTFWRHFVYFVLNEYAQKIFS